MKGNSERGRRSRNERGDAYAWFAALMLIIGIPLASLSIDIVRMMYVRTHLQTATDAACQAAADALDVPTYLSTGRKQIDPVLARSQADREFMATLQDATRIDYSITGLGLDYPSPVDAHCAASARVAHIIPMTPPMNVLVQTTSEMRVQTLTSTPAAP
ncbi:MAG TPA: pilus assembly protein TadG-related protein [Anaerolineales bacterium]|nr:pilus assembly protein TadG-related protein [Anaerolineales bacterium]